MAKRYAYANTSYLQYFAHAYRRSYIGKISLRPSSTQTFHKPSRSTYTLYDTYLKMCREIYILYVCSACGEQLSETSTKQWCREARRQGEFGRCTAGASRIEDESRREECLACTELREEQMAKLEPRDFATRKLGWASGGITKRTGEAGAGAGCGEEDDDTGCGYSW
ncbi:hypothetical protein MN608_09484 [Microdochium nivale]|nr:hypothetical protein MN608_09484 [Microdochium nivale]